MVTASTFAGACPLGGTRWFKYLVLSALINALIVTSVQLGAPTPPVLVEPLRINLMALAAPSPTPAPLVKPVAKPTPPPPVTSRVDVVKTATAKQAVAPVAPPQSKPVEPAPQPIHQEIIKPAQATPSMAAPLATPSDTPGVDATTVIHEAKVLRQTPPIYPRRAAELGQQGIVHIHAYVQPNGRADEIKVNTTSGHRLLDKAALAAVKTWRFEAPKKAGKTIAGWVAVPVKFILR